LWAFVLQLLQYLPQFLAIRLLPAIESTAFLASFRLFVQTGLVVTGLLLLYVQPKLFQRFQEYGEEEFLLCWRNWLPRYAFVVTTFSVACALLYTFLAPLLLTNIYAPHSISVLLALPGIVCLSLANYVQKILEVRDRVLAMAGYLAVSAVSLVAVVYFVRFLHPAGVVPRTLFTAWSLAFALYLGLVTWQAVRPPGVRNSASAAGRLLCRLASAGIIVLLGLLVVG